MSLHREELKGQKLEKIQQWVASKALSDNQLSNSKLKSKFIKDIDDCVKPIVVKQLLHIQKEQIPGSYIPYIINQVKESLYNLSNELLPEGSTEFKNQLTALHPFLANPIQQCYEHTYNVALEILYNFSQLLGDQELNTVHNIKLARQMFLSSRVDASNQQYYKVTDQELIKLQEVAKDQVPVYKKSPFMLVDTIIEVVEKFISSMQNDKDALIDAVEKSLPSMENEKILYNDKLPITIELKKLMGLTEIARLLPETLKGGLVTASQLSRIEGLTANLQKLTEELSIETKEYNDQSYNQPEQVAEAGMLIGEEISHGDLMSIN